MYRFIVLIGVFFLNINSVTAAPLDQNASSQKFISVADIHLDPFIECEKTARPCVMIKKLKQTNYKDWDTVFQKYAKHHSIGYGHDTDYFLFISLIKELQQVDQKLHSQFVLILGDMLAHNFREKYAKYTGDKSSSECRLFIEQQLQFMAYKLNNAFPTTDMYVAVGNNDSFTGNYHVVPEGQFLQITNTIWSRLIKNTFNQTQFEKDYSKAGYYSVLSPNEPKLKIIILNTVLFSSRVQTKAMKTAAIQQLKWLQEELIQATKNQQKVIIAFHIPSEINFSGVFKDNFSALWSFWKPEYTNKFQAFIKQYPHSIIAILPAHVHRDIFQFFNFNSLKVPVTYTPAVSPIFGNDPSFKIFTYQVPELKITKIDTYSDNGENRWGDDYTVSLTQE